MVAEREYTFVFPSGEAAMLFVKRLCLVLSHLVIFRDGRSVRVLDGSDRGQGSEIIRLARSSGSTPKGG